MKKMILTFVMLCSAVMMHGQSISYIETTSSWYYIYDQNGKKIKTMTKSIGELQGYSASFFIVKTSSWYYIYSPDGKVIRTLAISYVGEILSVSGDTFTSRSGSWIYTWSKDGKKLATNTAH